MNVNMEDINSTIVASKKTITKIPEFKIRLAWNGLHESLNRIGRISRISHTASLKRLVFLKVGFSPLNDNEVTTAY